MAIEEMTETEKAPVPVSWPLLRSLAGLRSPGGTAISLFVDLDPSVTPAHRSLRSRVRSLRDGLHKQVDEGRLDHARKLAIRSDFERIDEWLERGVERRRALGLALYASSADELWRELPVTAVLPDEAGLGVRLRLAPLAAAAAASDEGTLVAVLSRARARLLVLHAGRLEEITRRADDEVAEELGARSRPGLDHHLEALVHRHVKAAAEELDRHVRELHASKLVAVVNDDLRSDFEAAIAAPTRDAIVGCARARDDATAIELLDTARPVLEAARARRLAALVERWRGEWRAGRLASGGWEATLDACLRGQVDELLVGRDVPRAVFCCPDGDRVEGESGSCAVHGAALVREDAVELAIHATVSHGGTIQFVGRDELPETDGIGALLRFRS